MKKYFLTVRTYSNTTSLGKLVAKYIENRYDKTIVSAKMLIKIPMEIDGFMYNAASKNKRFKEMTTSVHGFTRGMDWKDILEEMDSVVQIWTWSSAKADGDNRAFSIHAVRVEKDYFDE